MNSSNTIEEISLQQEEMKKEKYQKAEKYWLERFSDDVPLLELPSYQPRPVIKTYNRNIVSHLFSEDFTEKLKQFSDKHRYSLITTLMSGIKALLYRYSNQTDIVVGTSVTERDHSDLENQVREYTNILAIRTQLNEEKNSFISLLNQEKEVLSSAYEHQVYPFDELVNKLNINKDTSHSDLFDVIVELQSSNQIHNTQELGIEKYDFSGNISQFDISYIFTEEDNQLRLTITYNTDIYDRLFITKMFSHFENLITKAIDHENINVEEIDFLTKEEYNQLLKDFNDTDTEYPKDKTFVDLFEEQVQKNPDNIAVRDSKISLTYRELKEKSDRVAAYLNSNYGYENDPIGIIVERSAELMVLLLGIFKSGKCYIPIDTKLPKERIDYIINHSQAKLIITEESFLEEKFNIENPANFILKNDLLNSFLDEVTLKRPEPKDTAYIIYTSGSTGNPKGVEIEHQALNNLLISIREVPGMNNKDILYSVSPYSFDITISNFYTPLASGACIFIAYEETLKNIELLQAELEDVKPSIIQATPSFFQMLFNAGWEGNKNMKILCGGDSLNESLAEKLLEHTKEVWNMYGPTETTVWSSTGKMEKASGASNIGKPINNTQIYIVDKNLNLVPNNTAGRIFIAGDGLSKGYYKNEQLTKEKFIDCPFLENTRMYETGDVGKWNEKGEIEFLGRNDDQVKIRGFRIELGEINTTLEKIDQVKAAYTLKISEKLVSFIHTCETAVFDIEFESYLRNKLSEYLPNYMVPHHFCQINEIPLSPNGKLDKKKLVKIFEASLSNTHTEDLTDSLSPKSHEMAMMWSEVLGIPVNGVHPELSFIEQGGDSLLMLRVVALCQKKGYMLTMKDFIMNPYLNLLEDFEAQNISLSIEQDSTRDSKPFSLSPNQQWFFDMNRNVPNFLMYASYYINENFDTEKIKRSIDLLADHYDSLRLRFKKERGLWMQHYDYLSSCCILEESEKMGALEEIIELASKKINIEEGPLLYVNIFYENSKPVMFIACHQLIMDAASWQIFINDLQLNYLK